jgi:hypothetical protein
VQIGDTVVDIGVVLDCRGRPEVGCPKVDEWFTCWLELGHSGDCMTLPEAKDAGRLVVPGMHWTLVGPEVEKEYPPHHVVRAFQLEEGRLWSC